MKKKYIYKNKKYKLLYDNLEVRTHSYSKFKPGVIYEEIESGLQFIREKDEFEKLFKLVE